MVNVLDAIREKFAPTPNTSKVDKETLNLIVRKMDQLEQDAEQERAEYIRRAPEWAAWAFGDKQNMNLERIGLLSPSGKAGEASIKTWQSVHHISTATAALRTLVAILGGDEVEIRYVPKVDEPTYTSIMQRLGRKEPEEFSIDSIARQGNTLFSMYRDFIGWHDQMHAAWMELGILDHVFIRNIVDKKSNWPDATVNLQRLNPWQVFWTIGTPLNGASEIVLDFLMEPGELKAQFPEFTEEIEGLKPTLNETSKGPKAAELQDPNAKRIWGNKKQPRFGTQLIERSKTSIRVRELWQFDPTILHYSEESDLSDIRNEHEILNMFIIDPVVNPIEEIPPDLFFKNKQFHRDHIFRHRRMIEEWNKLQLSTVQSSARDQARALMEQHITAHSSIAEVIPPDEEGNYAKFKGGWRQSIILGDGDALAVYDGESQFVQYGINGPPIDELNLMGWAFHHWGPSWISLLIDPNKIIDSSVNSIVDNLKWHGNSKIEGEETALVDAVISNDPSIPDVFQDGVLAENRVRRVPGMPANPTSTSLIGLMAGFSEQTAGIFQTIQGKPGGGVRSGDQAEIFINANKEIAAFPIKRLRTPLSRIAIRHLKLMFQIPPPDDLMLPSSGSDTKRIDFELLRNIDFTIQVDIVEGSSNIRQEQLRFLQSFMQTFADLFIQTGGVGALLDVIEPILTQDAPPELIEAVNRLKQQLEQAQAQQQAQAQAQIPGSPRGQPGSPQVG